MANTGRCPRCGKPFDDHWLPASASPNPPLCRKKDPAK